MNWLFDTNVLRTALSTHKIKIEQNTNTSALFLIHCIIRWKLAQHSMWFIEMSTIEIALGNGICLAFHLDGYRLLVRDNNYSFNGSDDCLMITRRLLIIHILNHHYQIEIVVISDGHKTLFRFQVCSGWQKVCTAHPGLIIWW